MIGHVDFESTFQKIANKPRVERKPSPPAVYPTRRCRTCGEPYPKRVNMCRKCNPQWWLSGKCKDCHQRCCRNALRCRDCVDKHKQGLPFPGRRFSKMDRAMRIAHERGMTDCSRGVSLYSVPYGDAKKAKAWEEGWTAQRRLNDHQ